MTDRGYELRLEDLQNVMGLPNGKASMFVEACAWCMDKHGHTSGVQLDFAWDRRSYQHQVCWNIRGLDLQRIRVYYNVDDALPFGAEAIALMLCVTHTAYRSIARSVRKTGIDYWLGCRDPDAKRPFQNSGRLEISGILTENEQNTLDRRVREKLRQVAQSATTKLPVYIVVVAFDGPRAKMVSRNATE